MGRDQFDLQIDPVPVRVTTECEGPLVGQNDPVRPLHPEVPRHERRSLFFEEFGLKNDAAVLPGPLGPEVDAVHVPVCKPDGALVDVVVRVERELTRFRVLHRVIACQSLSVHGKYRPENRLHAVSVLVGGEVLAVDEDLHRGAGVFKLNIRG